MVVLQLNTHEDVEKAIQNIKLVVVYFYTQDNTHCQKIGPWFNALDFKYSNDTVLYAVDIDVNRISAQQYFAEAVPVFKYFRLGQEVGTVRA